MFLLLALLSPRIPSLARASREKGSMLFWLMTTNVLPFSLVHTFLLSSMIFWTLSSMNFLSATTSFSLSSADL